MSGFGDHPTLDSLPLELLHQQLTLERKGVDASGRLFRLPGDNPDEMPSVLAARLAGGMYVAYCRDDLSESATTQLRGLTPEQTYLEDARVQNIVGASGPAWRGATYVFVERPQRHEYTLVVQREGRFVVEIQGVAAAEASSSRSTEPAAELAVETRPEFQRRGFGRQVSAAWANHQLVAGRVAFYSHDVTNIASAALARSLGVRHVFDIVGYA